MVNCARFALVSSVSCDSCVIVAAISSAVTEFDEAIARSCATLLSIWVMEACCSSIAADDEWIICVVSFVSSEMPWMAPRATQREKNIWHWSRDWKISLIVRDNPNWNDLYDQIVL